VLVSLVFVRITSGFTHFTMPGASNLLPPDQDPYLLSSRHEIVHLFRRMLEGGLLMQMKGRLHTTSTVTTLLHIDLKAEALIVDCAPQALINQALIDDGKASFEVLVDQVKVQFSGAPLQTTLFEGRPALMMPLPSTVRRIQRRGSYRVQVPVSNPATCTLALRPTAITLALHDISASGLALLLARPDIELSVGSILHGCTLFLPDVGRLSTNVQIVRQEERELPNGKRVRHVGGAFVDLRGSGESLLQSYIFSLERQMIARKRGLG